MKKTKYLSTAIIATSLLLGACSSNEAQSTQKATATASDNTESSTPKTTSTFKNGVLKTKYYTITYEKSEVIQSPMEDSKGLYITFDIKNTSKKNIVPSDEITITFNAQQKNVKGTSLVDLDNSYYFYDAFAPEDDTETYNKMIAIDKANGNSLLPDKSQTVTVAYYLDNEENPFVLNAIDRSSTY